MVECGTLVLTVGWMAGWYITGNPKVLRVSVGSYILKAGDAGDISLPFFGKFRQILG